MSTLGPTLMIFYNTSNQHFNYRQDPPSIMLTVILTKK